MAGRLPILVSVPHGGVAIPEEARADCPLSLPQILADGDTWTRHLYALADDVSEFQAADVARAVVDLNRAADDLAPQNPDGAVKSRTLDGVAVWRDGLPPAGLAEVLLEKYHQPYHRDLEKRAGRTGLLFAVDCHSMLPEAPPGGPGGDHPRPLVCLSNRGGPDDGDVGEGVTAPPALLCAMGAAFEGTFRDLWTPASGRPFVALNDPFKGGYVTRRHGWGGPLPWIQVELNRCLYMNTVVPCTIEPPKAVKRRLDGLRARVLEALGRVVSEA